MSSQKAFATENGSKQFNPQNDVSFTKPETGDPVNWPEKGSDRGHHLPSNRSCEAPSPKVTTDQADQDLRGEVLQLSRNDLGGVPGNEDVAKDPASFHKASGTVDEGPFRTSDNFLPDAVPSIGIMNSTDVCSVSGDGTRTNHGYNSLEQIDTEMSFENMECASTIGLLPTSLVSLEVPVSDSNASTMESTVFGLTPSSSIDEIVKTTREEDSLQLGKPEMTVIDLGESPQMRSCSGKDRQEKDKREFVTENGSCDHKEVAQKIKSNNTEDLKPCVPARSEALTSNHQPSPIRIESSCCRICQEGSTHEPLISPCYCSGTVGKMHVSCLETWMQLTNRSACELCSYPFPVERVRPPMYAFFTSSASNDEFNSLVTDALCFMIITPSLAGITLLCSRGLSYYDSLGKTSSVLGIMTLIFSLAFVYVSWLILSCIYHYRVWCIWREKMAKVRMCKDKLVQRSPIKQKNTAVPAPVESTPSSSFTSGADSPMRISESRTLLNTLFSRALMMADVQRQPNRPNCEVKCYTLKHTDRVFGKTKKFRLQAEKIRGGSKFPMRKFDDRVQSGEIGGPTPESCTIGRKANHENEHQFPPPLNNVSNNNIESKFGVPLLMQPFNKNMLSVNKNRLRLTRTKRF